MLWARTTEAVLEGVCCGEPPPFHRTQLDENPTILVRLLLVGIPWTASHTHRKSNLSPGRPAFNVLATAAMSPTTPTPHFLIQAASKKNLRRCKGSHSRHEFHI